MTKESEINCMRRITNREKINMHHDISINTCKIGSIKLYKNLIQIIKNEYIAKKNIKKHIKIN